MEVCICRLHYVLAVSAGFGDGMALGFPVVVLALRFLVERTEMVFVSKASEKPLLRREVCYARPPLLFSGENFLSGNDNGRIF